MRLLRRLRQLALLALCALPLCCPARAILDLDGATEPVDLRDWGDYLLDASGTLSPDEIASRKDGWLPTRTDAPYRLAPGQALWIRFTIPPMEEKYRWYLEVPSASVDRVTLYWRDATSRWASASAGDTVPVAEWPVPHRHPLLPFHISAEVQGKYYVRIQNARLFSAPLQFVNDSYVSERDQRVALGLGIYLGLAGLAALTAGIAALQLRHAAYARFAAAIALMGLTQAALSGIGGLHLWPRAPAWNDVSSTVLAILATASGAWAHMGLVAIGKRSRRIRSWMHAGIALAIPIAAAACLVPPPSRVVLLVGYVVVVVTATLATVAWAARRGDVHATWLLASALPVGVGAGFPLASTLGLMMPPAWSAHALQVGTALQWPVLLAIMMTRGQLTRENRRRLRRVNWADPVTGLSNEHEFRQRLARMMSRSIRMKYESVVLLVDIVNVERLRQDYGKELVPEIPLWVAGRLQSIASEIDSVARLSEYRFGMLIEGPLDCQQAKQLGARVVARCLMPVRNKPQGWAPRVHVAQAVVPRGSATADELVFALDELLRSVTVDSKRAVFNLPAPLEQAGGMDGSALVHERAGEAAPSTR